MLNMLIHAITLIQNTDYFAKKEQLSFQTVNWGPCRVQI
jgi:hypothetical protein